MSTISLKDEYELRFPILERIAGLLEQHIRDLVKAYKRLDRVSARAKEPTRFLEKAAKMNNSVAKYTDPLNQIQDQIGARIITQYLSDVDDISHFVEGYFAPIEAKTIVPDSPNEFGYEGKHYILIMPIDVITTGIPKEHCPNFFELQIKTLFQHAWGECNHDLGYKPGEKLKREQQRRIAFTAAQAWGADYIFDELFKECSHKSTTEV